MQSRLVLLISAIMKYFESVHPAGNYFKKIFEKNELTEFL